MTTEQIAKITNRMHELYQESKPELTEKVQRANRVINLRGASKGELVVLALEAQYGRHTITAWNKARNVK